MFSKVTFALSHELTNLKTAKECYSLFYIIIVVIP